MNTSKDSSHENLEDSLNLMHIEQLHKATLNFSNNCLETKKLCITVLIAVCTILVSLHEISAFNNVLPLLGILEMIISSLFYLVDVSFYYYQSKLRDEMKAEENEIRERHNIPLNSKQNSKTKLERIRNACINGSQTMYFLLSIASLALYFIST